MTENERLNNAIIAAIEEHDRLRAERDNAIAQCVRNGVNAEALRAEIDTLRQQQADDAESLTAAENTIRELRDENAQYDAALTAAIEREDALRAERDNWAALCAATGEDLRAAKADLAAAQAKIDSLRHHVKALQLLVKMQHAPQDMKLFAAEVDAIDAALAGKDAP